MKISLLAQDEKATGEFEEVIKGLQEIREQKLKEREEGRTATKVISNKREYIRHIFNQAINRIITRKMSTVQVKIADLGNACFDVSNFFRIKRRDESTNSFLFSTTILQRTFRRDNIDQWKFYWDPSITAPRIFGVPPVWSLNWPPAIIYSIRTQESITLEMRIISATSWSCWVLFQRLFGGPASTGRSISQRLDSCRASPR